ncbi:MAG: hypothetical protein HPM95_15275 [Alphaproteobacteria bacterium]|nr:hypothetical protein [Alphaproteobacteria bacterium]
MPAAPAAAANGGTVNVTHNGTISTNGDGAIGILAQSQGGGGGAAGDIETTIVHEIDNLRETLGAQIFSVADGGEGGDGGDVTVTLGSDGAIVTYGANAHGIFAYSVGGGGGAEGELKAGDGTGSIGSEGRDGLGGLVTVDVNYLVDVGGEGAVGVYAQSVSGGGESYSKGVDISVDGTVRAEGAKGRAILAQVSSFYEHDVEGRTKPRAWSESRSKRAVWSKPRRRMLMKRLPLWVVGPCRIPKVISSSPTRSPTAERCAVRISIRSWCATTGKPRSKSSMTAGRSPARST